MSFLALSCPCGWSLEEEIDETGEIICKFCELCKRRYIKKSWGWDQITSKNAIVDVQFCAHKRVVGKSCPHCGNSTAKKTLHFR